MLLLMKQNSGEKTSVRSIFTLFAQVGHYTTYFDKRSSLDNVIVKTKFVSLLEAYKYETSLLANRTFDLHCTYIAFREPNTSTSTAGLARKVETAVASVTTAKEAKIAAFTTAVATANQPAATAVAQAPNHVV